MFQKHIDLVIVSAATCLGILMGLVGSVQGSWLSVFGILLTLAFPGYVVSRLMLPALRPAERLLISLGLSIVIVGLSGMLLNLTRWGLQPATWSGWLGLITLGGAGWLSRKTNQPERTWPWLRARIIVVWNTINWRTTSLYGLAFVLLAVAFMLAKGFAAQLEAPLTNLWASIDPNNPGMVSIGVQDLEHQPMTYSIIVQQDGITANEWNQVKLEDGKTLTWKVELTYNAGSTVMVMLYQSQYPGLVYRQVKIYMPEKPYIALYR